MAAAQKRGPRGLAAKEDAGERVALAQAAMSAIRPVVDLLLKLGITSPEAESLMRGLFVHQARKWLASDSAAAPSDSRIALVTGVHRNFVRQILAEPPSIPRRREGRVYRPGRLIRAWQTDPRYCDEGGKPRDLPEIGPAPSFAALASQYLPGNTPSVLLEELLRSGTVQSLADHRIRLRGRTARRPGLHLESVATYGRQANALLAALTARLLDPHAAQYFEVSPVFGIPAARLPILRDVLARRAGAFLTGLEQELGRESTGKREKRTGMSVAVVEIAALPNSRGRNRGEGPK